MGGLAEMKILYVIRSVLHFSANEPVIKHLRARGHDIVLLTDPVWSYERDDRDLKACIASNPDIEFGWSLRRDNRLGAALVASRELLSYSSYLNRKNQSRFYLKRWEGYLLPQIRSIVSRSKVARWTVAAGLTQRLLRAFEHLAPPDRTIIAQLKSQQPDVVVASPVNLRRSPEVEYIKAARRLGIPTVIPVFSWDNLTTKGLYHIIPDVVLAWNRTQLKEAATIHRVPENRIVITGAPIFDRWLDIDYLGMSRETFCRRVGLDPDVPFVVYLGSSANIATDETWLVRELLGSLRRHPNEAVRKINILVRPHPGNARHYEQIEKEVVIWPKGGALPNDEEKLKDFFNTFRHSLAVVGINNSAMLEAVINDRPCVTIITDRYKATQSETGHFQTLLDFDILEITHSAQECADRIEMLWKGQDSRREARQRFVREFIRPRGLGRPAGEPAARAIELAALRQSAAEIDRELGLTGGTTQESPVVVGPRIRPK